MEETTSGGWIDPEEIGGVVQGTSRHCGIFFNNFPREKNSISDMRLIGVENIQFLEDSNINKLLQIAKIGKGRNNRYEKLYITFLQENKAFLL